MLGGTVELEFLIMGAALAILLSRLCSERTMNAVGCGLIVFYGLLGVFAGNIIPVVCGLAIIAMGVVLFVDLFWADVSRVLKLRPTGA